MVVLYMARNNKCNSPAGRGDVEVRFYNWAFRAICKLYARAFQGTLPRPAFERLTPTAVPHSNYLNRLRDRPFDRHL